MTDLGGNHWWKPPAHSLAVQDDPYPTDPPPSDLCPEHRMAWLQYRDRFYDPQNPTEWPGGAHIRDSRTSHAERRNDWIRRSRQQMDLIEGICRSGRSPECGPQSRPDLRMLPRRGGARPLPGPQLDEVVASWNRRNPDRPWSPA
jgi:hypothetical protein